MRKKEGIAETGDLFENLKMGSDFANKNKSDVKVEEKKEIKKDDWIMGEYEIISLLKRATQTEELIFSPHSTFATSCVLEEDYKILNYVFDELLPRIEDIRVREVVWLRAYGICWKRISRELETSETQCKRLYRRGIEGLRNEEK